MRKDLQIVINARFLTQRTTGVHRFAIEISKYLKKEFPEAVFLAPPQIIDAALGELLDVHTFGRSKGQIWEQFELPYYLRRQGKPFLLNLCNTAPMLYKNKMVTIHDLAFMEEPEWFVKKFRYYYNFLIPRIAHQSKKVITVSDFSRSQLISKLQIAPEEVKVIYNAVSKRFHPTSKKEKDAIENPHGKYILSVSSLDPRKNFKRLVLAYNQLQPKDTKLLIVGSESKLFTDTQLKEVIQSNPSIVLTGYVSDQELVRLYQLAEVFVYPSLFEGFGIPPLEAMACGCPTIVSNTSSLPEVCGDASLYCDPYQPESIALAIQKILNNDILREELIQKGFKQVQNYDWERSTKQLAQIIRDSLND